MRTTAALNRIIDKIAETQPARLESKARRRDAENAAPERDAAQLSSFAPRLADAPTGDAKNARPLDASDKIRKTENLDDVSRRNRERSHDDARRTQRRRQIDPTTCERDYSNDEIEFMKALDDYKRASGRMFPTCSEILEVFKSLGYVKIATRPPVEPSTRRNGERKRDATPAFLSDEEDDAFNFADAPALGIA